MAVVSALGYIHLGSDAQGFNSWHQKTSLYCALDDIGKIQVNLVQIGPGELVALPGLPANDSVHLSINGGLED